MRRPNGCACALVVAAAGIGAASCDGAGLDRIALTVRAEWRRDPGSVADVGYRVRADVRWADRTGVCPGIPAALRITVDPVEAKRIGGRADCDVNAVFEAGPFTTPDPITVRLFDDERLIGEAIFEGMFWGMQAELVSPANGQVRPGDVVVVSVPAGKAPGPLPSASWYWLDTAASVPPFYTTAIAELGAGQSTISAQVPEMDGLTGRVALIFSHGQELLRAAACPGFAACALNATYSLGPIALDVLAP